MNLLRPKEDNIIDDLCMKVYNRELVISAMRKHMKLMMTYNLPEGVTK